LATSQEERNLLNAFGSMSNDILSGTTPDFVRNLVGPPPSPMNTAPPPPQKMSSFTMGQQAGMPANVALEAAATGARTSAEDDAQQTVDAEQGSRKNRAKVAARALLIEFPEVALGVPPMPPYSNAIAKYAEEFGISVEEIEGELAGLEGIQGPSLPMTGEGQFGGPEGVPTSAMELPVGMPDIPNIPWGDIFGRSGPGAHKRVPTVSLPESAPQPHGGGPAPEVPAPVPTAGEEQFGPQFLLSTPREGLPGISDIPAPESIYPPGLSGGVLTELPAPGMRPSFSLVPGDVDAAVEAMAPTEPAAPTDGTGAEAGQVLVKPYDPDEISMSQASYEGLAPLWGGIKGDDPFKDFADPYAAAYESAARGWLGPDANREAYMQAVKKGQLHAKGSFVLHNLLSNIMQGATYHNYLTKGPHIDPKETQPIYNAISRASAAAHLSDNPMDWATKEDYKLLSDDQILLIGEMVRNQPDIEVALVAAQEGITGKGYLGGLQLQGLYNLKKYYDNRLIRDPDAEPIGFMPWWDQQKGKRFAQAPAVAQPATALKPETPQKLPFEEFAPKQEATPGVYPIMESFVT